MTQLNAGRIRFYPNGVWSAGLTYAVDDVVSYKNGFYICTVANTSTTTPDVNTSQWSRAGGSGMAFQGEWSNANVYATGDTVTYTYDTAYNQHYVYSEQNTYYCLQSSSNQTPLNNTNYWAILSKGKMRDKWAYLGGTNEGYIAPSKSNWDNLALAYGTTATPVGMGDSFGEFKTPGTHMIGINGMLYVNKRYNLVAYGNNNNNQNGSNGSQSHVPAECNMPYLQWFDGSLSTTPSTQAPRVLQVESDHYYATLVLLDNGEVTYSGYNGHGQRGNGDTTTSYNYFNTCGYSNINRSGTTTALRGVKITRIASTAGGENNAAVANYALSSTGTLYAWGYNGYGQLGQGNTTNLSVPTAVPFSSGTYGTIIEIWATGGSYGQLFILTNQGYMFACGYNGNGNLGIGSQTTPIQSLTLVKQWGTGTANYVKKFNTCGGGGTATSFLVVRGDGTLWTWGYNGNGQLGMNHLYNVTLPIQVYYGGYSGATNPVTTTGNAGTPSGGAVTGVWNAWMCGGNGNNYMVVTIGTSDAANTAYSCGYNGYYNLSVGIADSTNRSVLTAMQINSGTALTNVIDVTSNNGQSATAISMAVLTTTNEWYFGAYNNSCQPIGHADSYNIRQYQDPNYLANNYRLKNNGYWPSIRPTPIKQKYYKCVMGGNSTNKWMFVADLYTGRTYMTSYGNDYNAFNDAIGGSALATLQKMRGT